MTLGKSVLTVFFIYLLIFPLVAVFISPTFAQTEDWTIDGDRVYIDDDNAYISVRPHTLNSSGYVTVSFISKHYDGQIDMALGFTDGRCKVKDIDYYGIDEEWHNLQLGNFDIEQRNIRDMTFWHTKGGFAIDSGRNYTIRIWVDLPVLMGDNHFKYFLGFKPTSETLLEAYQNGHLYLLDPWWDSDWGSAIKLTFDNSASSENLVNFPVMVYLDATNINWTRVQDDLGDLRFLDSDNSTVLDAELENYNTNINATIHVRVPQIDAGSTTDHIFCYFDNAGASALWDAEGVWDANYMMVLHMNQSTSATQVDSTSNDNDGAPTSDPVQVNGLVDGSLDFDGSADYLTVNDANTLDITGSITLEAVVYLESNATEYPMIISKGLGYPNVFNYGIHVRHYDEVAFGFTSGSPTSVYVTTNSPIEENTWYHLVAHYTTNNYSSMEIYINGANATSTSWEYKQTSTLTANNRPVIIGASDGGSNYWNGSKTEIRISNSYRSASWINATYLTLFDNYITYGSEEVYSVLVENKSISSGTYSVQPDTEFNLSVYVAEVNALDYTYIDEVFVYLLPQLESDYLIWNSSGFFESDTHNHLSLNGTTSTRTGVNASTGRWDFMLTLYSNFTWGPVDLNLTSSVVGTSTDSDLYYDEFLFYEPTGGGGGSTVLFGILIAIGLIVGIGIYLSLKGR